MGPGGSECAGLGLKLFVKAPAAPPHTQVAAAAPPARGDLSRLLGVDAPPPVAALAAEPAPDARFQLIGVVSPRSPAAAREGLALIAVDGKPPKAYRVGSLVDGQNVLQSVAARGATLGPRGGVALVALNLAPPLPAATGMLPPAGAPVVPGAPVMPMPAPPAPGSRPAPMSLPPVQPPPGMSPQPPPQIQMQMQPQPQPPRRNVLQQPAPQPGEAALPQGMTAQQEGGQSIR